MANALIAYGNRIDGASLSLGSFVGSLPLANLKNRTIGRVARSTDLALSSTKFLIDFAEEKLSRTLALVNHNLSLAATVRVRAGNDPTMTTDVLFDSGWTDAWPAVYNTYDLPWEHPEWWSGKYSEEERQGYTWTFIKSAPTTVSARYWLIELDDHTHPAGYVQLGRVFVGNAWQTVVNMDYGASIGIETATEVAEAISGAEYFDERLPFRVARFTTGWMETGEAFGSAFEIMRRSGISGEVVFQQDPDEDIQSLRRQFYGRLRQLSPIEHPYPAIHSTGWEVKELL